MERQEPGEENLSCLQKENQLETGAMDRSSLSRKEWH
jgi:hypothetical protein